MEKLKEKQFIFDSETHRYYLVVNGEKKQMTGCTSVLGVIAKPALYKWYSDVAVDYVWNNTSKYLDETNNLNEANFTGVLEEARKAGFQKRDKAGNTGKATHGKCENWIRVEHLKLPPKETIEYDKLSETDKKMADKMINNFKNWATNNAVKFLESEKRVYSEKYFVAGTYDFKCEIDDKIYIGDIKTSSGIYDRTPFAQTAAYQMMELEMSITKCKKCDGSGGACMDTSLAIICPECKGQGFIRKDNQIDGRLIINIKKSGTFNEDKDVYASEYYEEDLELFMSALSIYRIMNNTFEPMNKKKSITI